jgi:hypothetical protein
MNSIPKIEYDKKIGGWRCNGIPVPNYNPDDCKLKFKKEKNMNEKSKKVIVRELEESKEILENLIDGLVKQSAYVGEKLHKTLKELDEINEVLEDIEDADKRSGGETVPFKDCCDCE